MGVHGSDRVQPVKWESTGEGGSTDEPFPSGVNPQQDALEARGIYGAATDARDETTYIIRDGDDWKFRDKALGVEKTLTQLAAAGSGISEAQHEALDTLVHDIDETSYDEVTYTGSKVTKYTVWASAAKLLKIREETYTYSGIKVSSVVTVQYDGAGATKMTMTESYTYSGNKVASVTRTKS